MVIIGFVFVNGWKKKGGKKLFLSRGSDVFRCESIDHDLPQSVSDGLKERSVPYGT